MFFCRYLPRDTDCLNSRCPPGAHFGKNSVYVCADFPSFASYSITAIKSIAANILASSVVSVGEEAMEGDLC